MGGAKKKCSELKNHSNFDLSLSKIIQSLIKLQSVLFHNFSTPSVSKLGFRFTETLTSMTLLENRTIGFITILMIQLFTTVFLLILFNGLGLSYG